MITMEKLIEAIRASHPLIYRQYAEKIKELLGHPKALTNPALTSDFQKLLAQLLETPTDSAFMPAPETPPRPACLFRVLGTSHAPNHKQPTNNQDYSLYLPSRSIRCKG